MLRIESSTEHSRSTCVDRPSRSPDEQFRTEGSVHRAYHYCCTKVCSRKKSTELEQCVSSRRSDAVDPPSEHAVLAVEVLTQGEACRGDGTILAGVFKSGIALENRHGSRAVATQLRCRSRGGHEVARVTARTPTTVTAGVGGNFRHGKMAVITQPCCSAGGGSALPQRAADGGP